MTYASPAMRMVPVRAGPVFGETVYWTFPPPGPDDMDVTLIQSAVLVAVQLHAPPDTNTSVMPNPPAAGMSRDGGPNDHVHCEA